MFRKPIVMSAMTWAPWTDSEIMLRKASTTCLLAMTFLRWSSSRKMKWSENTPACGATDDALAVDVMMKSMSPARSFCSITGSWPSWAPGNWLMPSFPPDSSMSFASKMSAAMP